jgi:ABC-type uncharacterized transport system ATPase component
MFDGGKIVKDLEGEEKTQLTMTVLQEWFS